MSRCMIIAAVAENNVIGNNNELPWRLPNDLKRFKALTMGRTVAMGRWTYESLPPKKLPGRDMIVLSRDMSLTLPDARVAHSLKEAMELPRKSFNIVIIGGGELYREAMPYTCRMVLTRVYTKPSGDTHFPDLSTDWCLEGVPTRQRLVGDEYDTAYEAWVRHL